ncbi:MAG TPA: hypothetical protein VK914_03200 [bacterium]|jgi:hypothetical protein|nr:hypothetical protein [bacterium]
MRKMIGALALALALVFVGAPLVHADDAIKGAMDAKHDTKKVDHKVKHKAKKPKKDMKKKEMKKKDHKKKKEAKKADMKMDATTTGKP